MDQGTQKLLEDLRSKPQSFDRDELIRAAERLRFHDFKSNDDAPKVLLVRRLGRAGFEDLARKAREGHYDQDEAEANAWAQSEEGKRVLRGMQQRSRQR